MLPVATNRAENAFSLPPSHLGRMKVFQWSTAQSVICQSRVFPSRTVLVAALTVVQKVSAVHVTECNSISAENCGIAPA